MERNFCQGVKTLCCLQFAATSFFYFFILLNNIWAHSQIVGLPLYTECVILCKVTKLCFDCIIWKTYQWFS
uniref:Uncharacterized protein n=1 Tax=Anguilla anguilla TaxID=7936 RepID=A0A0E9WVU9_ANGAN